MNKKKREETEEELCKDGLRRQTANISGCSWKAKDKEDAEAEQNLMKFLDTHVRTAASYNISPSQIIKFTCDVPASGAHTKNHELNS